ncbi:TrmA family tRNA (uracil-5-)-methyltransferase [Lactobacillus ultunensis DSM 16047]|uniref:23S rRNA (Uracil-5-)-methyltransferase RumA n=2 Tax=Lactobacillus ultunensis TaxID=227945 RepID=C2EN78_9LACO|nr:23S rRNA (uracil-5-)-methyltransferase RumA [Lactobacillus ultunensis DSM 16047]KRL80460.1 TrmA family tRNA (uracil-5-)-methyltransferase [Lactobacillus ultunensis DSM 16047]
MTNRVIKELNMRQVKMKKDDILDLKIDSLSPEGGGLAKYDDKTVFVRDALPGEEVKAKVLSIHKNTIDTKSVDIIKANPARVYGSDEKWANDGYARLANLKYDQQLKFKEDRIKKLLNKYGFKEVKVNKILPSPLTKGYRNEIVLPVREVKGQLEVGFFEPRTGRFIPLNKSIITNEAVVTAVYAVRDILRKLKVPAYDPNTNSGFIRDIDVRRSQGKKGMIVTLITHENDRVDLPEIVGLITEKLHNVNGVVLNYNPHKTDEIFGKSNIPLWGNDYVEDELDGIQFKISPKSYFQANGSQLKPITDLALSLLDLKDTDKLIDAFCGVGTVGLLAAKKVAAVRGIDAERVSIQDARENADTNKIDNATYYNGSVEQVLSRFAKNDEKGTVIMATPPAKGLSHGFVDAAAKMHPRRIVYGSTNPDTMVRDLACFKKKGYTCTEITPIDTAPQTPEVKCFGVLVPED